MAEHKMSTEEEPYLCEQVTPDSVENKKDVSVLVTLKAKKDDSLPANYGKDDGMETINGASNLWKFIQDQNNKVPVFSLLITAVGLPDCCSYITTSFQNAFQTPLMQNECFTHQGYITPIHERAQAEIVRVNQQNSFIYSIKSAMKYNTKKLQLIPEIKNEDSDFENCHHHKNGIVKCFDILSKRMKNNITPVNLSPLSDGIKIENVLVHGIGLVNLWEMTLNNKTTRPLLESFGKCFTRSLVWLFIDLDKDLPNIHLPLGGTKDDPKALSWRSRIEYLLRQCHLCKYSMYNKDEQHRVCTIFAIHTSQDEEKLRIKRKELQNECEDAARQMGMDELIDFDIQLVCNEHGQLTNALKRRMKHSFKQTETQAIPVSWLFLRELMNTVDKPWITLGELKKMAEDCNLDEDSEYDLGAFCKFYESFGSILQVKQLDKQSPYIITKPAEFLEKFNTFISTVQHEEGVINASEEKIMETLASIGIAEEKRIQFMKILVSVGIAVEKQSPTEEYFIPTIRIGNRKKEDTDGSVQFVLSMSSPHIEKNGEILTALIKQLPEMEIQLPNMEISNTVGIMLNEDGHNLKFDITFKGDVIEVSLEDSDGQCTEYALQSVVKKFVNAFHNMVQKRIYRNNIRYHFAVVCHGNKSKIFNPHQKRHILPKSQLCEECRKKSIDETPLIKAWIKELKENDVPKELKLNGDLLPDDVCNVVKEVMKYPLEAIHLFSSILNVEDVFTQEVQQLQPVWEINEHEKHWLVSHLIYKWQSQIDKEDESPKKVLARLLVECDKKWQEKQIKGPQFCKLALKVDMQVLTPQRQENLEKKTHDKLT